MGHGFTQIFTDKENPKSVFIWCARISLVRLADCEVSAMVIACSPCNGGPLREGNQPWEADR